MQQAATPIQKQVVLVGAGNAHLVFVRRFGMKPMPGVAVTLISEAAAIPYSAMVPGHIAGEYTSDEITIDLVRLCRAVGVRFIAGRATDIDVPRRTVTLAGRPELSYDVLSLGIGSAPARPASLIGLENSWAMRPLDGLIDRFDRLQRELQQRPRPFHLVIVGGGASGCELTLAIRERFAAFPEFRLTLLQGNERLLPQFPEKAANIFHDTMRQRDIDVRCSALVTGGDAASLELNNGQRLDYDAVLWATNAAPLELLHASGLKLSPGGFLLVEDTLQSLTDPAIFGTGDCAAFTSYPGLAKNGVYAVREGKVLFDNVRRFLHDQPLTRFRPQRVYLGLMNTADGQALLNYGPFVSRGKLARRLKDRIDRRWIDKFSRFPSMTAATNGQPAEESSLMRCGGCGNKISSDVLSAALKRIDIESDPRILLGAHAGEDAAVHRVQPLALGKDPSRLVEVQTVDYFKSFVDDPYLFGRIAALNSVSDLYAMNARPFSALAIATLPYARGPVQEAMLFELLSGAARSLKQLGVVLTGGHTTEGSELALGFAVTGYAEEDTLFQKSKLHPGDKLILTKPVGTGALLAAWMRGALAARWFTELTAAMLIANDRAAPIFAEHGVQACTDVTGFGLGGHLLEMLDASGVSARIDAERVPLYAGFNEVVADGIVSSLHADNAKAACRVQCASAAPAWLFDPQTAGGMLAAVKPDRTADVLQALQQAGYPRAAVIGEIVERTDGAPPMISI